MHRSHLILHSDDCSQWIEKNPEGDVVWQGMRESDGERFATQHNPPTALAVPDEFCRPHLSCDPEDIIPNPTALPENC
jgi:hypothetical protein